MNDYQRLSKSESKEVHKELLREPDESMKLFARRLLGKDTKSSLPISFELMLIDKDPLQIMQDILGFYCKMAPIQSELKQQNNLKRKIVLPSTLKKKKKQD